MAKRLSKALAAARGPEAGDTARASRRIAVMRHAMETAEHENQILDARKVRRRLREQRAARAPACHSGRRFLLSFARGPLALPPVLLCQCSGHQPPAAFGGLPAANHPVFCPRRTALLTPTCPV